MGSDWMICMRVPYEKHCTAVVRDNCSKVGGITFCWCCSEMYYSRLKKIAVFMPKKIEKGVDFLSFF